MLTPILIDGPLACGKSILTRLVSTYESTLNVFYKPILEQSIYYTTNSGLKDIPNDIIEAALNLIINDISLCRELNLRRGDQTSQLGNSYSLRCLWTMLSGGDIGKLEFNYNIPLLLHEGFMSSYFSSRISSYKSILLVRHPLSYDRINTYRRWVEIHASAMLDKGKASVPTNPNCPLPHYINPRRLDYRDNQEFALDWLLQSHRLSMEQYSQNNFRVVIPFEKLVRDPHHVLKKIEISLGLTSNKRRYERFIRDLKLPRESHMHKPGNYLEHHNPDIAKGARICMSLESDLGLQMIEEARSYDNMVLMDAFTQ